METVVTKLFIMKALDHILSGDPWRDRGFEDVISYVGNQLCLHDGTTIRTPNTEAQLSFPGWQYSIGIITYQCW